MLYYTYIIQSLVDNSFYKGSTQDPLLRIQRHNNGETVSTRHHTKMKYKTVQFARYFRPVLYFTLVLTPWKLVFLQTHSSKTDALIAERKIKCYSREKLFSLIKSEKNVLELFLNGNINDSAVG